MKSKTRLCWVLALSSLLAISCHDDRLCELGLSPRLLLATTTSTENSGLLNYLMPHFEQRTGIHVDVVAVGTGRALRLAQNGDADVVLVHAPQSEEAFVDQGHGVNRRSVMYNEFVVVGPSSDPAGIRGQTNVARAFSLIRLSGSKFVSRGDDSGTHLKEREIWAEAGGPPPPGESYVETGQGMAATLLIADEMEAYCLTDIATYLTHSQQFRIEILAEGDPRLRNPYHIMAVNPQRHPRVKYLEAMLLIAWITSPEGTELIEGYTQDGKGLFIPDL